MPESRFDHQAAMKAASELLEALGVYGDSERVGDQVNNLVLQGYRVSTGDLPVPTDLLNDDLYEVVTKPDGEVVKDLGTFIEPEGATPEQRKRCFFHGDLAFWVEGYICPDCRRQNAVAANTAAAIAAGADIAPR